MAIPAMDQIPESNVPEKGDYTATVTQWEFKYTKKGDAAAIPHLVIDSGPHKGHEFEEYCMLEGKGANMGFGKIRDILVPNNEVYDHTLADLRDFVADLEAKRQASRQRVGLVLGHEYSVKNEDTGFWDDVTEADVEAGKYPKAFKKAVIVGIGEPKAPAEVNPAQQATNGHSGIPPQSPASVPAANGRNVNAQAADLPF